MLTTSAVPALVEEFNVRTYRSIFLDDGWAHQKYYGWKLIEDHPALRVLEKRRMAFTRCLILLTAGGESYLEGAVERINRRLDLADVLIHDFDGVLSDPPLVAGLRFHRAERQERMLNIATYVVDLKEDDDTLWHNFGTKSRNAVRKAESNGTRFICDGDFREMIDCFYKLYEPIARRHTLEIPDYGILKKMKEGGNLTCVACIQNNSKISLVNVLYMAGPNSFYMYGASDSCASAGVGQFVQWHAILLLKRLGYQWYDLGGIQDPTKMDGIHQFKKSIGGAFYKIGDEFKYETPTFAFLKSSFGRLRR